MSSSAGPLKTRSSSSRVRSLVSGTKLAVVSINNFCFTRRVKWDLQQDQKKAKDIPSHVPLERGFGAPGLHHIGPAKGKYEVECPSNCHRNTHCTFPDVQGMAFSRICKGNGSFAERIKSGE